jgi:hypothetical protein
MAVLVQAKLRFFDKKNVDGQIILNIIQLLRFYFRWHLMKLHYRSFCRHGASGKERHNHRKNKSPA